MGGEALGEAAQPFSRPLPEVMEQYHRLGTVLARLHAVTDSLTLPPDFTRPRWDRDGLLGAQPPLERLDPAPEEAIVLDVRAGDRRANTPRGP